MYLNVLIERIHVVGEKEKCITVRWVKEMMKMILTASTYWVLTVGQLMNLSTLHILLGFNLYNNEIARYYHLYSMDEETEVQKS